MQVPVPLPVREVAKRVWKELSEDNVGLLAAGVAFYAMLALFPSLIALVTIYGLVADPARVADQIEPITKVVPESVSELLIGELTAVASASGGNLTLGLVISILAALWAASGGVSALITGINAVYDEPERRNFVRLKALALAMTLGGVVVAVMALLLVAAFPAAVNALHLGGLSRVGAEALRWLLLAALVGVALTIFYRVAPGGTRANRRKISIGALIALVIWMLGSIGFSVYVSHFGSYNKTYGTLAAVVVLMLWLYLSAYVILLGAEIDSELEKS